MKLKYYLRGIGIGIIVATLIMSVSSIIHNNNLSDEKIIQEAKKLGMIMPEADDDKDSLWDKDTQSMGEAESVEDTEKIENTETVENSESTESTEILENTNDLENTESTETETLTETQEETATVVIVVEDTDSARHVSNKLEAAGVIEDAVDFRSYLKQNGYATVIRSGYHRIPIDATYEEICSIIIKKTN